jgi:DNA-3-methyladenine glycosylase I
MKSDRWIKRGADDRPRCWWGTLDPLQETYHDTEWGRPQSDDRLLFEKISLEGFQSGLSWLTILRKRENFRDAFAGFEIERVAKFGARDLNRLLKNAGIVRNRAKIEATINNARRCADLIDEFGSLASYVWQYEPPAKTRPRRIDHARLMEMTTSDEATAMSKDLRKRGWKFVGPTTAYAFMQAMGLVNDHLSGCAIGAEVEADRSRFRRPQGSL